LNKGFEKAYIRKNYYSNGENAILMVRMWVRC
jgi:ribosomal protein S18 acetylase RimI-like enzyme